MTIRVDDASIIDRARNLRHEGLGEDSDYDCIVRGANPLCGDEMTVGVRVRVVDGSPAVTAADFEGYSCSLCSASADELMERVRGMTARGALGVTEGDVCAWLGGLEVGSARRRCVSLPVDALRGAIRGACERGNLSLG
jgi:NifU-like protein involved in Fe-S cluster formation